MSEGGMPQAGYNPHAVGAAPGGQPNPANRLLGVINDANVGTGMQLNNLGPLKGNVPSSVFQDKGTGWKDKMQSGLGVRTRVQFEGFERIGPQDMDGIEQAAQMMRGADMQHIGPVPESALTGMGSISPPATPGMSQARGIGGPGM